MREQFDSHIKSIELQKQSQEQLQKQLQEQLQKQKIEIEQIQNKIIKLIQTTTSQSSEIERLTEKVRQLEQEKEVLDGEKAGLIEEIKRLNGRVAEFENIAIDAVEETKTIERKLNEIKQYNSKLSTLNEDLETANFEIIESNERLQEESKRLQDELNNLKKEKSKLEDELKQNIRMLHNDPKKSGSLRRIHELNDRIRRQQRRIDEYETTNTELVQRQKKRTKTHKQQISDLSAELDEYKRRAKLSEEKLEEELTKLDIESKYEVMKLEMETKHTEENERKQEEINRLTARIEELEQKKSTQQTEIDECKSLRVELKKIRDEMESAAGEYNNRMMQLAEKNESLQNDNDSLLAFAEELNDKNISLKQQLKQPLEQEKKMYGGSPTLENEYNNEMKLLKTNIDKSKKLLDETKKAFKQYESELDKCCQKISDDLNDECKNAKNIAENAIKKSNNHNDTLEDTIQKLNTRMEEINARISSLNDENKINRDRQLLSVIKSQIELETKKKDYNSLNVKILQYMSDCALAKKNITESELQIVDLSHITQEQETIQHSNIKEQAENSIEVLREQRSEIETNIESLTKNHKNLLNQLQQLDSQLEQPKTFGGSQKNIHGGNMCLLATGALLTLTKKYFIVIVILILFFVYTQQSAEKQEYVCRFCRKSPRACECYEYEHSEKACLA